MKAVLDLQRQKNAAKTTKDAEQSARERAPSSDEVVAGTASVDGMPAIGPDQRREMIAIAAYYLAEQRRLVGISPEEAWLEAEAEVDHALGSRDS